VSGSGGASVPSQTLESGAGFEKVLRPAVIEVLDDPLKAEAKLDAAKSELAEASGTVSGYTGTDPAERANLELKRDERVRALQDEDKRYQIAKDLADNLTIGYNTSEVIMARLHQTTNAKERVYAQAVSFFSTNDSVLTALKASFTGLIGLHESDPVARSHEGRGFQKHRGFVRTRRQGARSARRERGGGFTGKSNT
jgi:hypothetical protein